MKQYKHTTWGGYCALEAHPVFDKPGYLLDLMRISQWRSSQIKIATTSTIPQIAQLICYETTNKKNWTSSASARHFAPSSPKSLHMRLRDSRQQFCWQQTNTNNINLNFDDLRPEFAHILICVLTGESKNLICQLIMNTQCCGMKSKHQQWLFKQLCQQQLQRFQCCRPY